MLHLLSQYEFDIINAWKVFGWMVSMPDTDEADWCKDDEWRPQTGRFITSWADRLVDPEKNNHKTR